MPQTFMTSSEVQAFVLGKTVRAYDPDTDAFTATIVYGADGSCEARFANGETDSGQYGFEGQFYWTCYENFRAGRKHRFTLHKASASSAQAYHEDGSKAFLLSHKLSA